tara:strand:- start:5191 stop:6453 length:1263 start_codon:yes stop_codon:yes gene_type:complete
MIKTLKASNIVGYFFSGFAFILPIIGFIAPKGNTLLAISASLLGFIILKIQNRKINFLGRPFIILFLLIALWSLTTSFWAPNAISAITGSMKLLANFLIGAAVFSVLNSVNLIERRLILRSLSLGFFVTLALIFIEVLFESPINIFLKNVNTNHLKAGGILLKGAFWLNSSIVNLSLFLWVLFCYWLNRHPFIDGFKNSAFIIVGFFSIILSATLIGYITGIVAILIGLVGWLGILIFRKRAVIALAAIFAINAFSLPFLINGIEDFESIVTKRIELPNSAVHRIKIWKFTAKKIYERPLLGWGMNASKYFSDGKNTVYSASGAILGEVLPLHPHNSVLQIWLEFGLPGILIFLCLGYYFLKIAHQGIKSDLVMAIILGQFLTFFIFASLSFGLWQSWWICLAWFAASFMKLAITLNSNE